MMCICLCVAVHVLQMELKECRLKLAEERRARLKAESRLIEVMIILKILRYNFFVCYLLFSVLHYCSFSVQQQQLRSTGIYSGYDLFSAKLLIYILTRQDP